VLADPSGSGAAKNGGDLIGATMADYVATLRPCVPEALVSEHAMSSILALAGSLPPCPLAGFECRLGGNQSIVDFQVQVPRRPFHLSGEWPQSPAWRSLHPFWEEWLDESSTLHQNVSATGLEFDMERSTKMGPAVFVALRNVGANPELLAAVAARFADGASVARADSTLRACVEALPDRASIQFIGAMRSRAGSALRVNVSGLPAGRIAGYLKAAGWPHPVESLGPIVTALGGLADDLALCLDITDRLLPRIGIECILREQPLHESRWRQLLDYLTSFDACSMAKGRALLTWTGDILEPQARGLWPANLFWGDRLLGARAVSTFYRYLSHTKVIYEPGQPIEAKAYLGFFHQWLDRAAVTPALRPQAVEG
jgi:hypothetical protein